MTEHPEAMKLLQKHFDIALETPGGIKKLRELILTLAMQGKLVKQDPKDQPAAELLKEIEAEKKRLVKAGKIRKQEPLPPIKKDEMPYAVPNGWEWVRLNEIAEYNGRPNAAPDEISTDTWVLDLEDIEKDTSIILNRAVYAERQSKSTKSTFCKGDVLYGKLRPYLNKVVVADRDGVCTTEIVPLMPFDGVDSIFLKTLLKRPSFIAQVNELSYGVKMPRLGTTDAVKSIHPLPPLAEQKRIVAKIDQLMALCDKLEAERHTRDQKRLAVHAAAVNRLLAASEQPDFDKSWQFIVKHFSELYAVPANVAELKKVILQLAVMGKLVPQNLNDQPASELLKEIESEKKRLVKEGKIRKQEPLSPIKKDEMPYAVPNGWQWVRLANLIPEYQNGIAKRGSNLGSYIVVLRLADITGNEVSIGETRSIRLTDKEIQKYLLRDGDILITRVNGSVDLVGSFIRFRHIESSAAYCDHFIRMRLPMKFIDIDYLHTISKSALVRRQIEGKFVTTAGQKTINQTHITTLIFPLPPLAEQKRIVARIEQLMALCDMLDKQIAAATGKQTAILNAVLAKV